MGGPPKEAIPFFIVAGLTIAQSAAAAPLRKRVEELYASWNRNKQISEPWDDLPDHLHPSELARLAVDWVGDAVQALGAVAIPLFGFFVLVEDKLSNAASLAYLASMVLALLGWMRLVTIDRPHEYIGFRPLGMSLLSIAIIFINAVCAIGVLFIPSPSPASDRPASPTVRSSTPHERAPLHKGDPSPK